MKTTIQSLQSVSFRRLICWNISTGPPDRGAIVDDRLNRSGVDPQSQPRCLEQDSRPIPGILSVIPARLNWGRGAQDAKKIPTPTGSSNPLGHRVDQAPR